MSSFDDTLFVNRDKEKSFFEKLLLPSTRFAVMVIEAPEKMGKTWLLRKMEHHCRQADVNVPVAKINFRDPLDKLNIPDFLGVIRLLRDRFNRPNYFTSLNATIDRFTGIGSNPAVSEIAQFAQDIAQHFNLADLNLLAAFVNVNIENLPGNTLIDKAFALVNFFFKRNDLSTLIAQIKEERPLVQKEWGAGLLTMTPSEDGAAPATRDEFAPIRFGNSAELDNIKRQINTAFFNALGAMMATEGQIVLLLDAFEAAPQEIKTWIVEQLLPRLNDPALKEMVVILAGRTTPDLSNSPIKPLVVPRPPEFDAFSLFLESFTIDYVKEYLERRNIPESPPAVTYAGFHFLSEGRPGVLAEFADIAERKNGRNDPFFS